MAVAAQDRQEMRTPPTPADWRVHGIRSDGKRFAVVYDNPAKRNPTTARIVSAWPLRREKGP
jgi:hypothetical protein